MNKNRKIDPTPILPIDVATVGNIKNSYQANSIVYAIDYPIISNADAIIRAIPQFLAAEGPRIVFQRNEFWSYTFLQRYMQFFELSLRARNYLNFIGHYALCVLRSSFKKLLRLWEVSWLRVSAMAKSIISSLKRALCINPARMAFCSAFANARNAVKKISALAWITVIFQPPLYCNFIIDNNICQEDRNRAKIDSTPILMCHPRESGDLDSRLRGDDWKELR